MLDSISRKTSIVDLHDTLEEFSDENERRNAVISLCRAHV